jgi:hypothetical protein
MYRYSRVVGVGWRRVLIFCVQHLNGEQLFAQLLVPIGEELIAMKTFAVLAALRDLRWQQADGVGGSFIERRLGRGRSWRGQSKRQ